MLMQIIKNVQVLDQILSCECLTDNADFIKFLHIIFPENQGVVENNKSVMLSMVANLRLRLKFIALGCYDAQWFLNAFENHRLQFSRDGSIEKMFANIFLINIAFVNNDSFNVRLVCPDDFISKKESDFSLVFEEDNVRCIAKSEFFSLYQSDFHPSLDGSDESISDLFESVLHKQCDDAVKSIGRQNTIGTKRSAVISKEPLVQKETMEPLVFIDLAQRRPLCAFHSTDELSLGDLSFLGETSALSSVMVSSAGFGNIESLFNSFDLKNEAFPAPCAAQVFKSSTAKSVAPVSFFHTDEKLASLSPVSSQENVIEGANSIGLSPQKNVRSQASLFSSFEQAQILSINSVLACLGERDIVETCLVVLVDIITHLKEEPLAVREIFVSAGKACMLYPNDSTLFCIELIRYYVLMLDYLRGAELVFKGRNTYATEKMSDLFKNNFNEIYYHASRGDKNVVLNIVDKNLNVLDGIMSLMHVLSKNLPLLAKPKFTAMNILLRNLYSTRLESITSEQCRQLLEIDKVSSHEWYAQHAYFVAAFSSDLQKIASKEVSIPTLSC